MVETREMKTIGGVLLYVRLLVGLKHLIIVCKVAVAADTPGMPEGSVAGFNYFWNR